LQDGFFVLGKSINDKSKMIKEPLMFGRSDQTNFDLIDPVPPSEIFNFIFPDYHSNDAPVSI